MQWSAEPEPPPPQPPPPQRERRPRAADPLAGLAEELSRAPAAAPEPSGAEPAPRQPLLRREPRAAPRPQQPAAAPAPAPEAQFSSSADQNLAEMAQRLEAALRRPGTPEAGPPPQSPAPPQDLNGVEPPPPTAPDDSARPAEAKGAKSKSVLDSLEEEMANLLGRPPEKT